MNTTLARILLVAVAGGTVLLLADDVSAQELTLPYSSTFVKCSDSAASTQASVECYDAETKVWDARLNAAYQLLMRQYKADDKDEPVPVAFSPAAALRQAQRAWIAFRDADCKWQASAVGGGSITRIIGASCYLDHVILRTLTLEQQGKDD